MALEQQKDRLSYEEALRVMGRHLDAEPAYYFSLSESPDGFMLRYWPTQHHSEARTVHFSWDRLRDLAVFQTAGRGCSRKRGRHQGLWASVPGGHQDFFRALGSTLDREQATNLTLEEVPEGVAFSYLRPDPDNSLRTLKQHTIFSEDDVRGIVASAQKRRGNLTVVS